MRRIGFVFSQTKAIFHWAGLNWKFNFGELIVNGLQIIFQAIGFWSFRRAFFNAIHNNVKLLFLNVGGWIGIRYIGWTDLGCIIAESDLSGTDNGTELGTDGLTYDWRAATASVSEAIVAFRSEIVAVCFLSKQCEQ